MNRKRAFTLIELLVVIAIIAILAAILFPVFAQAKLQAKKTAALSNTKQITLAEIMYQNDYDDDFVESGQNFQDWQCGLAGASGAELACINDYATPTLAWDMLLQPYIKTLGLFVDPATGDPNNVFGSSGVNSVEANWNAHSEFGYNYTFLSPIDITGLTGGGTVPASYNAPTPGLGRASTAAVNPAGLVMFVSDQGFATATSQTVAYNAAGDFDLLVPPGVLYNLIKSSKRLVYVGCTGCANWSNSWIANTPVGALTANVRTMNPYMGGVTGFADGHAKSTPAGSLAAGTDYGTATTTEGSEYGSGTGSQVININAYMWTLDGTLNDVN